MPALAPEDLLLIINAKVITLDAASRIAQAVAIRGGRIVRVGSTAQVQAEARAAADGARTRVIDAAGAAVIPGLIDSHVHALDVARAEAVAPYVHLASIDDIQAWVRAAASQALARRASASAWIWTPRLFPTRLRERRFPSRAELDAAAPTHPVCVNCAYALVLNTAALHAAGITRDTPDPPGGTIARDADGAPTGLLYNASSLVDRHQPDAPPATPDALDAVHRRYNAAGITSVIERAADRDGYRTYEHLRRDERLRVRATVSLRVESDGSVDGTHRFVGTLGVAPGQGDEWLKAGPLKLFVDGGILGGSSFMRDPYGPRAAGLYGTHDPDYRGKLALPADHVVNIIRAGRALDWQLAAHVTGDAGVDAVLDAVETVDRTQSMRHARFTLVHAYFPHPDAAQRAARLGVAVDTQPAWFYKDAAALSEALGPGRVRTFIGLREWLQAGVRVAINTDHMLGLDPTTALNPFSPFLTLYAATTRRTEQGDEIGADQAVSREQALRMMTRDAAYLAFDEARKGSIEEDKLGDLVVLSDDPLTCPPERLRDMQVRQTIVGGRVLFDRG